MSDISNSGRTILFVSHQLGIVSSLCKKSLLLNKGQVHSFGNTGEVINNYFKLGSAQENKFIRDNEKIQKEITIQEVCTVNKNNEPTEEFLFNQSIILNLKITVNEFIPGTHIGIALLDKMESRVFYSGKRIYK